ncbi:hypothetical protein AKJ57_04890 [candidate division MSBL1 archaeon SCGC-AAA259A05]|uniref:Transposase IS4-like domain-containing protein n=1 Tax=candidate division MSBL1 archaeon SCGC-AAA259A05 TaxID=1698259 RepID=A0A133U6G9_9EURY|nr:hypothetical protein AKJ57_04890 [candidate division MSBL1 archaeon SCGC-AAA259A05]
MPWEFFRRIQDLEGRGSDDTTRRYILCIDEETRKARLETLKKARGEAEKELQELAERFEKSRSGKGRGRPMTVQGAMNRVKKILGENKRLFDVDVDETIEWRFKEEVWEYERAIAGKFLLVTTTDLKPSEVRESYKELKDVEKAFDELKNFLDIRPIYHRTNKRVKEHVFVCILALLLRRLIEKKTGETFGGTMDKLEEIKLNIMDVQGEEIYQRNRINQSQKEILKALDVEKPPKILTK